MRKLLGLVQTKTFWSQKTSDNFLILHISARQTENAVVCQEKTTTSGHVKGAK